MSFNSQNLQLKRDVIGSKKHSYIPFKQIRTKIGRSSGSSYRLPSDRISKDHCELFFRDKKIFIRDLNSTKGTFVNDTKLDPSTDKEIFLGDCIGIAISPLQHDKADKMQFVYRLCQGEVVELDSTDSDDTVIEDDALRGDQAVAVLEAVSAQSETVTADLHELEQAEDQHNVAQPNTDVAETNEENVLSTDVNTDHLPPFKPCENQPNVLIAVQSQRKDSEKPNDPRQIDNVQPDFDDSTPSGIFEQSNPSEADEDEATQTEINVHETDRTKEIGQTLDVTTSNPAKWPSSMILEKIQSQLVVRNWNRESVQLIDPLPLKKSMRQRRESILISPLAPKKRGRKRKNPELANVVDLTTNKHRIKRGRPKKNPEETIAKLKELASQFAPTVVKKHTNAPIKIKITKDSRGTCFSEPVPIKKKS